MATNTDTLTVQLTAMTYYSTMTPLVPSLPLIIPKDVSSLGIMELATAATNIPVGKLKLIFHGHYIHAMDCINVVKEFGLKDGSVLFYTGKPEGEEAPLEAVDVAGASISDSSAAEAQATLLPTSFVSPRISNAVNALQTAFATLHDNNTPQIYASALTMLDQMLLNIARNPREERFRSMRKQNPAFQKVLGGLTGGHSVMQGAGFKIETYVGQDYYVLSDPMENLSVFNAIRDATEQAAQDAHAAAKPASGKLAPMPMDQYLSNPDALRAFLTEPMSQEMIQNNPDYLRHSILQKNYKDLVNDPNIIRDLVQAMNDPAVWEKMQSVIPGGDL